MILGIGMNVNHIPKNHESISNTSTSLQSLTSHTFSRSLILKILLRRLNFYYSYILQGQSLTQLWADKLTTLGTSIKLTRLNIPNEKEIHGTAQSVNNDGSLNVKLNDGTIFTASSGEVTLGK
tara:strand:- start:482 stop:850 length:369 start_codon:yes stop_codon:yes gene_type:complete